MFKVVIPARHGASRLPGKPLRELAGKPMIWHVWQRAVESGAAEVVIATEHDLVVEAVQEFGGEVCLTSDEHVCGSDRVAEVCRLRGWDDDDIVVNLQGDEPCMPAANLQRVADAIAKIPDAEIATLCTPVGTVEELLDPNVVKVIRDRHGFAMYFSRAPIPWNRQGGFSVDAGMPPGNWYHHVGLYAYRVKDLRRYTGLSTCELEQKELLEQLRALWHGMRIYVGDAMALPGIAIDTEADLLHMEKLLQDRS